MKTFIHLLFIISIGANALFLISCSWVHKQVYGNPCKYSVVNGSNQQRNLTGIANSLGIKTTGRDETELERRITEILDSKTEPTDPKYPESLTTNQMNEVEGFLSKDTTAKVRKMNDFISDLNGKTLILYEPEK